MPIKSHFFPTEALQGEDLPSHMIWAEVEFDCVKIVYSKALSPREIYNVDPHDIVKEEGAVKIRKTQVNGYLGVVFSSRILENKASDEEVEYSFLYREKVVEHLCFKIHLFRPDIIVHDVPNEISVDLSTGEVVPRIPVRNLGEGTAIVDILTTKNSGLKKHPPEFMRAFVNDFNYRIKRNTEQLKSNFRQYSSLLAKIEKLLTTSFDFEEQAIEMLKDVDNEFSAAVRENAPFGEAVRDMLVESILRSPEFSNVYQFILEYISSIGKERILIRDPFSVICLSGEPTTLKLEVRCIDLLGQMCVPIPLHPISVRCKQRGEIALFKMFKWGEGN